MIYEPISDPCRLCGDDAPHDWRFVGDNVEIVCMACGCLLDNVPAAKLLTEALDAAETWGTK